MGGSTPAGTSCDYDLEGAGAQGTCHLHRLCPAFLTRDGGGCWPPRPWSVSACSWSTSCAIRWQPHRRSTGPAFQEFPWNVHLVALR